ncbi:MAG: hypothetical protein HZB61_03275 [Nitrospirae bacterium]|nr:hypothetical protein [Nitrospirota bacterium]
MNIHKIFRHTDDIFKFLKQLKPAVSSLILFITVFLSAISAQSATVTGTFRFLDELDPAGSPPRPIAYAKVEIWHVGPYFGNTWAKVGETTTYADGWMYYFDNSSDGTYAVRVFATNYAAVVWPDDVLHTVPFHREPGEPGPVIHRQVFSVQEVADFTYDFTDSWSAGHYNIADTVRHGYDYANARRDPGETDPLPQANMQKTSVTGNPRNLSWYNPAANTVIIEAARAFEDYLILHEYTHWLEANISSFIWSATDHDGCAARDIFGNIINSPEHAWMEGFADFFEGAVGFNLPAGTLNGSAYPWLAIGNINIESPPPCTVASADTVESFVAASLWDLIDEYPYDSYAYEPFDFLSRMDTAIFQIFDKELDIYGVAPTIWDFRNAWIARGLDQPGLDRILSHYGILPPMPDRTAQFIAQDVPASMFAGQTYNVSVTMRNTGINLWASWSTDKLGSQNPQDNLTWGINRVTVPVLTLLGAQVTFNFSVTAPSAPGTYNFQWRMIHDTAGWFGDYTPNVAVNVYTAPDLAIQSVSAEPATPVYGENVAITVNVRNQGSADAGQFYVDFYKDRITAPGPLEYGDAYCYIGSLAAGASAPCIVNVSYAAEGMYSMWAQVDANQYVSESNENNNIFGPQTLNVTCPLTTYYRDYDNDGYGDPLMWVRVGCEFLIGYVANNLDCNDNNANEHPGQTWHQDADNDGISTGNSLTQCARPAGYRLASELTALSGDCNDNNSTVYLDAPEICDGLDNNCDGKADNSPVIVRFDDVANGTNINTHYSGPGILFSCVTCTSGSAFAMQSLLADSSPNGVSLHDWTSTFAGEEGAVKAQFSALQNHVSIDVRGVEAMEIVGTHHEKPFIQAFDSAGNYLETVYYPYEYGNPGWGTWQTLTINRATSDIKYILFSSRNNLVEHPNGVSRGVGGIYGEFDNLRAAGNFTDSDGDGYSPMGGGACGSADCNDNNAAIHPGALEVCDGIDNNCNGLIDDAGTTYYRDIDGDGYGNPNSPIQACSQPAGYVTNNADCNDDNRSIHPGVAEICDGVDNNCNGQVDEGVSSTYYADKDSDGYGDPNEAIQDCSQPAGYVTDFTDCNDKNPDVHPGTTEICKNKIDDNCNGVIDEMTVYYLDEDGDGYGNPDKAAEACEQPAGFVADNTDCNDADKEIHPAAAEVCNGADDNCNGMTDEGFDADGDGVADCFDNCPKTANKEQLDIDLDSVGDVCDNCRLVSNPDQLDGNAAEDDNKALDGIQHYGNLCDPDFDESGFVNIIDFNEWRKWAGKTVAQGAPADIDLDGNGTVWIQDFNIWRKYYGKVPGPGVGD